MRGKGEEERGEKRGTRKNRGEERRRQDKETLRRGGRREG